MPVKAVLGDILSIKADVVALKYAQAFYGADAAVASRLAKTGMDQDELRLPVGQSILIPAKKAIRADQILFVGVAPLIDFTYTHIRRFSRDVLHILSLQAPQTT